MTWENVRESFSFRGGSPIAVVHLARARLPYGMAQLTVWHDGACPLCRREIALMRRLDRARAIDFVDARADEAACPIDQAALLSRFHARENGIMLSGAAAFAATWRAIPVLRPLGLAARSPWVLRLLERAYLGFLRVRPRLQRLLARDGVASGTIS